MCVLVVLVLLSCASYFFCCVVRRRAVVSGVSYAWHDTVIAVDYIHRRGGRRWGEWYRFTQRPIAVGNYRFMSLLIRQLLTFSFFTYAFLFACTSADGSTRTSLPRRCSPSCNTHDGSTPSLLCAPSSAFPSASVLAGARRQSSIVWPPPTASSTPPPSLHVLSLHLLHHHRRLPIRRFRPFSTQLLDIHHPHRRSCLYVLFLFGICAAVC